MATKRNDPADLTLDWDRAVALVTHGNCADVERNFGWLEPALKNDARVAPKFWLASAYAILGQIDAARAALKAAFAYSKKMERPCDVQDWRQIVKADPRLAPLLRRSAAQDAPIADPFFREIAEVIANHPWKTLQRLLEVRATIADQLQLHDAMLFAVDCILVTIEDDGEAIGLKNLEIEGRNTRFFKQLQAELKQSRPKSKVVSDFRRVMKARHSLARF